MRGRGAGSLIATVLAVMLTWSYAGAAPIQWTVASGGNGHYYEGIYDAASITWDNAKLTAAASTYLGQTGYLATITSSAENTFVADVMAGIHETFWVGGTQPSGSAEPDGDWGWITGETWNFTSWRSGEPNDNGDENALSMHASDHALGWGETWNDLASDTSLNGYVVEYVPEPATVGLLAIGGLALIRRRRRQ